MRILIAAFLSLFMIASLPAFSAMTLEGAKAEGLVGERADGLIGSVAASNPDVAQLIATVNKERLERYASVAAKNGTDVSKVQALAGQKLIDNTPAGQFVQDASGSWVKK